MVVSRPKRLCEFGGCTWPPSCSHVHSAQSAAPRRRQSRPQPLLPSLRQRRETLHFWSATPSVRKAMFAFPRAQAPLPGPSLALGPKPTTLRQPDLAEFSRWQQGAGKAAGIDCRRLRRELPECWRDWLPPTPVHRVATGANWRQVHDPNHLHPTLKHQRGMRPR